MPVKFHEPHPPRSTVVSDAAKFVITKVMWNNTWYWAGGGWTRFIKQASWYSVRDEAERILEQFSNSEVVQIDITTSCIIGPRYLKKGPVALISASVQF